MRPRCAFPVRNAVIGLRSFCVGVRAPDVQRTIRRLDDLFDGIIVCVVAAYFGLLAAWLQSAVSAPGPASPHALAYAADY